MKTLAKTLLRIAAFFGVILGWHAVMPLSICWLTGAQIGACIICGLVIAMTAIIIFIEAEALEL